MKRSLLHPHSVLNFVVMALVMTSCLGCPPALHDEAIDLVQSALTQLKANRTLVEQFASDVKKYGNPGSEDYLRAMESYTEARGVYDKYLDVAESRNDDLYSRSLGGNSPKAALDKAADFLDAATRVIKPQLNTRAIPFERAIKIPDNLALGFRLLPRKSQDKLIKDMDPQLRWLPWSEIRNY